MSPCTWRHERTTPVSSSFTPLSLVCIPPSHRVQACSPAPGSSPVTPAASASKSLHALLGRVSALMQQQQQEGHHHASSSPSGSSGQTGPGGGAGPGHSQHAPSGSAAGSEGEAVFNMRRRFPPQLLPAARLFFHANRAPRRSI
jgi:hypothetical protein